MTYEDVRLSNVEAAEAVLARVQELRPNAVVSVSAGGHHASLSAREAGGHAWISFRTDGPSWKARGHVTVGKHQTFRLRNNGTYHVEAIADAFIAELDRDIACAVELAAEKQRLDARDALRDEVRPVVQEGLARLKLPNVKASYDGLTLEIKLRSVDEARKALDAISWLAVA